MSTYYPMDDRPLSAQSTRTGQTQTGPQAGAMVNYLARAVPAYESRLRGRVAASAGPPDHPYKSLFPYDVEDAGLFFGRLAAVETLHARLRRDRLTVLHARSGTGKTSLLNAGLAPRLLRDGRLPVYVRAYDEPVSAIKAAIAPPDQYAWPDLLSKLTLHQFLILVCDRLSNHLHGLVIVLDHFEEFFSFWPQPRQRRPFIDALADCYQDTSLPVHFIISIRKDHFSDLAEFQPRIPTVLYNEYRLDAMTREEIREAITGPLGQLNRPVSYEPALVDALLADLTQSRSPAPPAVGHVLASSIEERQLVNLQLNCARLFEALGEEEGTLALGVYAGLDRAEDVVQAYLSHALERMPEGSGPLARAVLKELVSSLGTRRTLSGVAMRERLTTGDKDLEDVLDRLVDARLLRREATVARSVYELAHDCLIKEIAAWIDGQDLALKRVQDLLAREVATWRLHGTLIPPDRLKQFHTQRERLKGLDERARECLLRSSLRSGFGIEDWAAMAGGMGERLLLGALNDRREHVRQAVIRSLGAIWGLREVSGLGDESRDARLETAKALGEIGDRRAVGPLVAALGDGDPHVRQAAVAALAELGDPRALGPLIAVLGDEYTDVRQTAVDALGMLGDSRVVPPIIVILRDPEPAVRRSAIRALGTIWELAALTKLGDEDHYVAWDAAKELGRSGDLRVLEPLIAVLQDEHIGVRRAAAEALVALGEPAVEPLIAALQAEDWDTRRGAAQALGELGKARAMKPLVVALRDSHSDVRRAAAEALVRYGEPAVEPLIAALSEREADVRCVAAGALGQLGYSHAAAPLILAARDRDGAVRSAATTALVQLGAPAVEHLINALGDESRHLRQAAAGALGEIGDVRAIDPLVNAMRDADSDVRRAAAAALEKIGDPRTVEPLIVALRDGDRFVRREATWALGQLGDRRAVAPLITALRDDDRGVRQAAATALVKLGPPAVDPLGAALKVDDAGVRWAVIGVLGELGDLRASEPLIGALRDEDSVVRRAAAAALGKIGDTRSVGPLIALLQDKDSGVRWAATGALGQLGDARAVDPLIASLRDDDSSVRRGAGDALRKIGTPQALDALS